MAIQFSNQASTTLASGVSSSATSLSVTSASSFPSLGGGDYLYATIGSGTSSEIVRVTGISGTTFTVVRGQDDTTAATHLAGVDVSLRVTAGALEDLRDGGQVYTAGAGLSLSANQFSFTNNFTTDVTFAEGADIITATAGTSNFRAGVDAGTNLASGSTSNTFVGDNAGKNLQSGDNNVAVGKGALQANTGASANVAVGMEALFSNQSGGSNSSVGFRALYANTTGSNNMGVGQASLRFNTTGSNNLGIGVQSLFKNTTGFNNVGTGLHALYTNQTGSMNTASGGQSLKFATNSDNTAFGGQAGMNVSTGILNTFLGRASGSLVTTGSKNTILGAFDGNENGLDIRTSSNNIVLSDGDGNPRLSINSSGAATFASTLNGRNIATDGAKLDAIEVSATADQTAAEILTAIKTVDGSGSGLDADLLDGQHGSHYLNYSNLTNTPSIPSLSGYATESYVGTQVSNLVDSSPATLNTLNELAAALGDDANFSTTVTNSIATKLPLAGGTLTGGLTISVPDAGGAPAMSATLNIRGYEGRGAGIKIQDSANSASNASNREWFIGSGYSQSGFNIGYSSTGSQSSYSAQNKFSIDTSGNVTAAGSVTATDINVGGAATFSAGATFNGTATMGGLTVDASSAGRATLGTFINTTNAGGTEASISLQNNQVGCSVNLVADRTGANFGSDFYIENADNTGALKKRLNVSEIGDVSFYNTAGDSQAFFWDASAKSLSVATKVYTPLVGAASDTDTNISFPASNQMRFINGGVETFRTLSTGSVFNEGSADLDFRVESDGNSNMLLVNGGNNSVSVGTSDSTAMFTVGGTITANGGAVYSEITQGAAKGTIHLDPDSATDHAGTALTFGTSDSGNGNTAHAGIYTRTDGNYGTKMYLSTTDNYSAGSKTALKIDHLGHIGIMRGDLKIGTQTVIDSSRNLTNIGTLNGGTAWRSNNDGSGSGLDADLLDGADSAVFLKSPSNVSGWQNSNANFSVRGGDSSNVGLHMEQSNGVFGFQLYSAGGTYGFLDAEWGGWDIQKARNGNFSVDEGAGLQRVWNAGNDSSGSGLDADLLDGQHGSYYYPASNPNGYTNDQTAAQLLAAIKTVDVNGSAGLNAGTLDGHALTSASTPNTVAERNTSGDINARLFRSEYDVTNNSIGFIMTQVDTASNNFVRPSTPAQLRNALNVEDGATADQTASQILTAVKTVDGTGSGLDADLLDGHHAYESQVLDTRNSGDVTPANFVGKRLSYSFTDEIAGSSSTWDGVITVKGWSGAYRAWQIMSDSSNNSGDKNLLFRSGIGSSWGSLRTVWDSGNDGSGSGLDADLLDGQHGSYYYSAGNPAPNQTITLSGAVTGSGTTSIATSNPYQTSVTFATNGPDNALEYQQASGITDTKLAPSGDWYNSIRMGHGDPYSYYSNTMAMKMTSSGSGTLYTQVISNNTAGGWNKYWHTNNDGSGSGLDADLLDGLQASAFLGRGGGTMTGLLAGRVCTTTTVAAANDGGSFSVRGDTSKPAVVSFHRAGAYAVNFGLSTANKMELGGWSAVGIKHTWDFAGNYTAVGNITAYSDIRVKTNIEVIPKALDKVCQLSGYTFDRTDFVPDPETGVMPETRQTGVIAQEVLKVLPEAVSEMDDGKLTVAYGNMVGLLIESIKELKAEIEDLKTQIGD